MPTNSWRINVNEIDTTQSVGTSPEKTCATCGIFEKGPKEWKFYDKGSTQKLLNLYGYPSSDYPAIQDVLDVNKHSGVWVCAPYKSGTYGGVIVTSSGTIPFGGSSTQSITSYSGVDSTYDLFIGNGSKTLYSGIVANWQYYNVRTMDILLNDTSIVVTASGTSTIETLSSASGTGTFNKSNGTLVFTFNTPPVVNASVKAKFTMDVSSIAKYTLFNYNQQADDLQVKVLNNTSISGAYDIYVQRYDPISASYLSLEKSPYTVGLLTTSKDSNGLNIYIGNIFNKEEQLFVPTIQNSIDTTFIDDTQFVNLNGGNRGTTISGSDFTSYYELLKDTNTYPTNLIFDTTSDPAVASEFNSLRASDDLKYTSFVTLTPDVSADTIIATPTTYRNNLSSRGIFCYCLTWGVRTDIYQGNNFNCSNIGLIVSKIMDSMINDPSVQPMYFNESNGLGGQLDSGIISLNQNATQSQLRRLDALHFNPIVNDPQYGVWIVGARTTLQTESVYSYIAQSIEADLIIKDIIVNILTPQQGKANDDFHRSIAKANTDIILGNYQNGLDDFFSKCDRQNNNDIVLNSQKFILSVAVRFVSYAMTLTLNFVTTKFGTDVTEVLN